MCGTLKKSEQQDGSVTFQLFQTQGREEVRTLLRQLHEKLIFVHMVFSNRKFDALYDELFSHPLHPNDTIAAYFNKVIGTIWATGGEHTVSESEEYEKNSIATCK